MLVNNTRHAVAEAILTDADGREVFVAAAKATFTWDDDGELRPLAEPLPLVVADVFVGAPETTGLAAAGEITLPKSRVDVLVQGEIVLSSPAEHVDCTLQVGRLVKAVRVIGDRHWRQGPMGSMSPSRPRPFVRMPIDWQRSSGGTDPDDPACVDARNPIGRGVRRRPALLEGHPAPNFEDPQAPVSDPTKVPEPVGWGPIAPHWQSRRALAGTYDDRWRQERFPLLPVDFDRRFLNVAPADQQLDRYQPGVEVRLTHFTARRIERFVLPELAPPLTVIESRRIFEIPAVVDTVIIDPVERRVSLVARACHAPRDVQRLAAAFLGPMTPELQRAIRGVPP